MGDDELWRRFREDGYIYLPGMLDRDELLAARRTTLEKLDQAGYLDPNYPLMDGVAKDELALSAQPDLAKDNEPLNRVLYDGRMITFYEQFLGGPVSHFDFTWCRVKTSSSETATRPHFDIVFMGRGTKDLYTSWTPLGDVLREMGGLIILENSHRLEDIKQSYGTLDVDVYCTNYPDAAEIESGEKRWHRPDTGAYTQDAIGLRQELGLRWLTADYKLGDLLIFSMYIMHARMSR